ncbi:hypothetical protein [Acidisphaera sp. S103]|uniref:hypothetical protein n=1 Tax=Acidisphaera sp. S103 TaxID=1747223 RepID=UPI001C20979F|nr:hypothetical protein [Acidisphaera sp. S103]
MGNTKLESIFDTLPDEAEEVRRDAIADAEIEAGLGVPHTKVREWLKKLAQGKRTPPPTV